MFHKEKPMPRKFILTGLSACLVIAPTTLRADSPAVLEPLIITATRLETPERELASSITVITRKEIEASQKSSVYEVLRGHPALDVVRTGGPGNNTAVFMR